MNNHFVKDQKVLKFSFCNLSMKWMIIIVLIILLGCVDQEKSYTEDESLEIAREFVLTSPTYKYDGEGLKHVDTVILRCLNCWQFVFEFTSRSAGYGDRSGQMVAQVITHHTAEVTVESGEVTSAVLDDTWDIITQEQIK